MSEITVLYAILQFQTLGPENIPSHVSATYTYPVT